YSPISTRTLREACRLWATARNSGNATSSKDALDGDVILAAQALELGAIVITSNRKHLSTYGVTARDWSEV
ncbi:MAG: type II toxin-antitoxin system VapC family toxin, partial [Planctomycetota bacterium]